MNEEYPEGGARRRAVNELILPRGEYAYTRDKTSGVTSVRCGPTVINMQGSEEPVVFDQQSKRFNTIDLQEAAQINTTVPTGHYAVMHNPAKSGHYPEHGNKNVSQDLLIGQRVHIPGPISFALWPRQDVQVIEGHQLRSNQYLIVRVYDEEAARESWSEAVVKTVATSEADAEDAEDEGTVISEHLPEDLSVGRLLVIRGTQVSFYIPPTGMMVVPNEGGSYVREALTLERLQYCILIDESGNKRYVRGPDVVFPLPTERFYHNEKNEKLFRPIELNGSIQGLHIKVIAGYTDESGDHGVIDEAYHEGQELFVTGETTPIYFPCEQHSAIRYDGKTKHFATAIPAGDGRYVLNRHTGAIRMVLGEEEGTMCLPDPRIEVFVRRVLSDSESEAMYPGNAESLEYNRRLRAISFQTPTTRKGVVSEGDLTRGMKQRRGGGRKGMANARGAVGEAEFADMSLSSAHTAAEMGGDEFSRAATYTEPRTVTIGDDKFSGVPKLDLWTGFCVMVVDTTGDRRVIHGPQRVLLGFNETLEVLSLSTGRPKNTDNLLKTAYLQVENNKVSDTFAVVTADHVSVQLNLAYQVNFEGDDPTKWFGVSNYVKLLCDHMRSVVKAKVRTLTIEEFWARPEEQVRDFVLGVKPEAGERLGMVFDENAMRIYDVEVLHVGIGDAQIQQLLVGVQHEAVQTSIELARDSRRLDTIKRREILQQEELSAKAATSDHRSKLAIDQIAMELSVGLAGIAAQVEKAAHMLEHQAAQDKVLAAKADAENSRNKSKADSSLAIYQDKEAVRLDALAKETEATVSQLKAAGSGFSEALLALGNQETMVKVAEAMSVQNFLGGKDLASVVQKVFAGTPMEKLSEMVVEKATGANGSQIKA